MQSQKAWLRVLLLLSKQIDHQVSSAGCHSSRVAHLVLPTARQLACDEETTRTLYWAAQLHDIGKLSVPDSILRKTGPLSNDEWRLIRLHPTVGASLVRSSGLLARIAPVVSTHQEKYDGSGYPWGLRGEQIPLGARILAVADAYDAMTNDRFYRKAYTPPEAIHEIERLSGQHFDPYVVSAFLNVQNHEMPLFQNK